VDEKRSLRDFAVLSGHNLASLVVLGHLQMLLYVLHGYTQGISDVLQFRDPQSRTIGCAQFEPRRLAFGEFGFFLLGAHGRSFVLEQPARHQIDSEKKSSMAGIIQSPVAAAIL
jgi:hypothetical protein